MGQDAVTTATGVAPARSGRSRRRVVTTAFGVILVALACALELRRIAGSRTAVDPHTIVHRIAHRGSGKSPVRLQILVAVRLDPSTLEIGELHEVLATIPPEDEPTISFAIGELGLRGKLDVDRSVEPAGVRYDLSVDDYGARFHSSGWQDFEPATFDMDHGQPFATLALGLRPAAREIGLLRAEPGAMVVLVRRVFADDQLEEITSTAAVQEIVARLNEIPGLLKAPANAAEPKDALLRLLAIVHPVGALLLAAGVLLVCAWRVSLIQSLVIAAFACVIVISAFARLGFSYHLRRFNDPDPAVRAAAIVRVAHGSLFTGNACHALREQFRREQDDRVRATTVLAAASGPPEVAQSDDVADLLRAAADDPSDRVRAAAARARN